MAVGEDLFLARVRGPGGALVSEAAKDAVKVCPRAIHHIRQVSQLRPEQTGRLLSATLLTAMYGPLRPARSRLAIWPHAWRYEISDSVIPQQYMGNQDAGHLSTFLAKLGSEIGRDPQADSAVDQRCAVVFGHKYVLLSMCIGHTYATNAHHGDYFIRLSNLSSEGDRVDSFSEYLQREIKHLETNVCVRCWVNECMRNG